MVAYLGASAYGMKSSDEGLEHSLHLWLKRSMSFCASALHSVVFPVPGGPCKSTVRLNDTSLGSTPFSPKEIACTEAYSQLIAEDTLGLQLVTA